MESGDCNVHRDDGELEQIMVVVSLSFREVFSSLINRARARSAGNVAPTEEYVLRETPLIPGGRLTYDEMRNIGKSKDGAELILEV